MLLALACMAVGTTAWAEDLPKDTLKVVDIEEVTVIASPKENRKLREQPLAATLLSQKDMQANQVTSMKSLTALVPNLFIPDYGSRLTSAIYIRGIGSRINTPSVGLYVDNIPYLDKSAFDFNYSDVERIDVLRGPQGTLYGRNTMGGLIKVYTKSPFSYQGTDVRLSAATYNSYNASLTHYHRISDKLAFSAGGFYEYDGGFFDNETTGKKADQGSAAGGRMRAIYLPTANLKLDLNVSYQYSDEGAYPYYYTGTLDLPAGTADPFKDNLGTISNNRESTYYRNLLNTGLNLEYSGTNYVMTSVTGFQYLKDRMFMDQDFLSTDLFTIEQKQKQNTLSEELSFKSRGNDRRWDWVTGAFGYYQWQETNAPVTFQKDGINMIQSELNKAMAGSPMAMQLTDEFMPIPGVFDTPTLGAALFHQSTFNDLLFEGLSATIGLRVDYEKYKIDYNTSASMKYQMLRAGQPMGNPGTQEASLTGKMENEDTHLLPKFALKYDFSKRNNIYATASRGYRSGGYNFQNLSQLIEDQLKTRPGGAVPTEEEKAKEAANVMPYKPEYTWNYELGSHLTLWNGKLQADLAAFYMDTQDQQISKFADSGLGRMTVNAGKSRSIGAEASVRTNLTDAFNINLNYGYTYATFTDYTTNEATDDPTDEDGLVDISYDGNYVPFVPKHTFSLGGQYIFRIAPNHWFDEVQFNADYCGAGRIYWTEQNNASQAFYGTLNGRVALTKGPGQIAFWIRNALDKEYDTFYFESMGRGFEQKGRPMQIGVDIRCRF